MSSILKKLSRYHRNGIISLKELKRKNPYLFRYLIKKGSLIDSLFSETGIRVMNDLSSYKDIIPLYLKYYYNDTVNLSDLRKKHNTVYRHICKLGKPEQVISEWGFTVIYKSKISDEQLKEMIQSKSEKEFFDKSLYNRIYYRAKKLGLSVPEFLETVKLRRFVP